MVERLKAKSWKLLVLFTTTPNANSVSGIENCSLLPSGAVSQQRSISEPDWQNVSFGMESIGSSLYTLKLRLIATKVNISLETIRLAFVAL